MKELLEYKGYHGSVEISVEDDCLFGKVQFIQALVNYEGKTVSELSNAFHESVEDYMATCETKGVEPERPFKGSFNVRVGPERHARAAMVVKKSQFKSLNEFVNHAIDHEIERLIQLGH